MVSLVKPTENHYGGNLLPKLDEQTEHVRRVALRFANTKTSINKLELFVLQIQKKQIHTCRTRTKNIESFGLMGSVCCEVFP